MKKRFTIKSVAKELDITEFMLKSMAISGKLSFVSVEKKGKRNTYYFDPLKTNEYIKQYKEIKKTL